MSSFSNFNEQKKEIELSLARILLTQLQKGVFTFEESQKIARNILEGMDNITDSNGLLEFLKVISRQFPIFDTTYGFYKIRIDDEKKMKQTAEKLNINL